MEKIIHFTVPERMSAIQVEAVHRARELHPNWEINVWQDPIQSTDFLLAHYWPKVKSGAQLADLVRLDVLYKYGGIYVDSDVLILKPLDELADEFDFFIATEDGHALTNAAMGARKRSLIIRSLIDTLIRDEPDWSAEPNMTTGPALFSTNLRWRKDVTVLPRETFYAYNWNHTGEKKTHRHSYGEHLWAASWKSAAAEPENRDRETALSHFRSVVASYLKQKIKQAAISGFDNWRRLKRFDKAERTSNIKSYQCVDELVVQTIHGFNIIADGRDVSITPTLVFNGYYELAEESFVRRVLKGGDWVVDVGSNVGSISLLAANRVGPFGRVFSYEPNARPIELMAKSAVMNWIHDRIVTRQIAVGERGGTLQLSVLPDSLGASQIRMSDDAGPATIETSKFLAQNKETTVEVPCTYLDGEFPVNLPIKLLKVDVEGYEGHVLAGASRLLRNRCFDYILIELLQEIAGSKWHQTILQVEAAMRYGYKACTLSEDGQLVEHGDLATAMRAGKRNIVLVAEGQYVEAPSSRK